MRHKIRRKTCRLAPQQAQPSKKAKELAGPDARARMIQLETRLSVQPVPSMALSGMLIEPVSIIAGLGLKPVILTQNRELLDALDATPGLAEAIAQQGSHEYLQWRVLRRGATHFQGERIMYDCLAVRPA